MEKKKQVQVIQALRGIAALMVMIYHKREVLNTVNMPIGEFFFGAGAMGVDLFFIISGFIMVLVHQQKPSSQSNFQQAWQFAINRITRIFPLYAFTIFLFYLLVWQGFSFLHDEKSAQDIGKSLSFIPLDFKKVAPFYGYAAITVGWTLNYEIFFYLLLAISILFGKLRYAVFSILILLFMIVVPLFWGNSVSLDAHHHYQNIKSYLNLTSNPIIWDFVLGMLLGAWYQYKSPKWNKGVYYFLLFVFGLWNGINLLAKWNPGHGFTHWALPIFGLVTVLVFYEKQYGLKIPQLLLFLGKISFSIYLLHPVVQFAVLHYGSQYYSLAKWMHTPIYLLVTILLTILIATITQFFIENHFGRISKNALRYASKKLRIL